MGTDPNRANNFLRPLDGEPFDQKIVDTIPSITEATFTDQGVP
ncbi:MAG: hypothetical protein P1U82_14550 [Verrucomicrobiales bacterium]|jgi:hypothetical protein|nr:hypothetical protein [Verrucomicrobiales bacterium]